MVSWVDTFTVAEAGNGLKIVVERQDDGGLKDLLVQMEKNLSTTIAGVQSNVNRRLDKFESDMERYVLKEVHLIEIGRLRDEANQRIDSLEAKVDNDRRALIKQTQDEKDLEHAKQSSFKQKVTWSIALLAVAVAAFGVLAGFFQH